MSNSSPTQEDRTTVTGETTDGGEPSGTLERRLPAIAKPIRVASFWLAILLPFLYLPLLLNGLTTLAGTLTFFGLLGANVALLYVGHSHRQ